MLEVTADDIAALADGDLRTLVGLLCEAELRKRGLPASTVTWGGQQDAADGGIDVRVDLPPDAVIGGFIPRPATGFQVKKPDMAPAAIEVEMRPKGALRPSIRALADRNGCYIIVCSSGSVADAALASRRKAMAECVKDIATGACLALDFYDRARIATWVRDHPGLIPWLRRKAGREIKGWQSYGAWANPSEEPDAPFVVDDASRIYDAKDQHGAGLTVVEGLTCMRKALSKPRSAVRLVGLSGVGKTRLVQALFDSRIGEESLDPALAFYTNTSDSPEPAPVGMVSDLLVAKSPAIVVVDNCSADLHRRLAEVCKSSGSTVSVLTVEYDIREDQPEGTEVFSLEPSSADMTEKVLLARFGGLSQVDARRIAEVSGGNFRVAIALAGTVERGASVSGLADAELFDRLFWQRQEPDPQLRRAAEVCSLLYSFDGETVSEDGELARLGSLVGQGSHDLFARVAELRRRDLVQTRSIWRAVLPHAIANRLAAQALQNIAPGAIEVRLVAEAPERVKRSFSRRLGYLHDSDEARRIVESWLAPGGILGSAENFDGLHVEMLSNVAPVTPEVVLAALERAAARSAGQAPLENQQSFVRLLRLLAYDANLFERCAMLLADFAAKDNEGQKSDAASAMESLFFVYLSGTHATVEQRITAMEGLVGSQDPRKRALGLQALGALLKTSHFMSMYSFEFGSRSRDFGYRPTFAAARSWYAAVLKCAEKIIVSGACGSEDIPPVLASAFRGLWTNARMVEDLERLSRVIVEKVYWREGWIAIRQTIHYDQAHMPAEAKARLVTLEKELRPKDLLQKIRSIVLSSRCGGVALDEYEEDDDDAITASERTDALAMRLGAEAVHDDACMKALANELVSGSGRLVSFGIGLGANSSKPSEHWKILTNEIASLSEKKRNFQILIGFLKGLGTPQPALAASLLDAAVNDEVLGPCFPFLQCGVPIGEAGTKRLRRSLTLGLAPIEEYRRLAWGRAHETVSARDLKDLVMAIGNTEGGVGPALEIVFYRFFGDNQAKKKHEPEIIEAGRALLCKLEFIKSERHEHELGLVVKTCLVGEDGAVASRTVCERFKTWAIASPTDVDHYHALFEALCKAQPLIVLDTLFTGDADEQRSIACTMKWLGSHRANPLDAIPMETLIAWCNRDPVTRYLVMAGVVSFMKGSEEEEVSSQWTGTALGLIELAPDPVAVARIFAGRFHPSGWSGSLASILEGRKALLEELTTHANEDLATFAAHEMKRLEAEIDAERRWESQRYRARDERFE